MKYIYSLFILLLFCYTQQLNAQCNVGGQTCFDAEPIACDLAFGTLPGPSFNPTVFPLCPTGVLDNPQWFSIDIPTGGGYSIEVTPVNCETFRGIQAGIYASCNNPNTFASIHCDCTMAPIDFSLFLLPITYYLVVDGCAGDICDYIINISPTIGSQELETPAQPEVFPPNPCPGEIVNISVPEVPGATQYIWSLPLNVDPIDYAYCNEIQAYWWTDEGGAVSVIATNQCDQSDFSPERIVERSRWFGGTDGGFYCHDLSNPGWYYEGIQSYLSQGNYDFPFISENGCDSIVRVEVIAVFEGEERQYHFEICEGDQVDFAGRTYTSSVIDSIKPDESPGQACNSLVIVEVDVLEPILTISASSDMLDCDNNSSVELSANFNYNGDYFWSSNDGQFTSTADPKVINVWSGGTYYVEVALIGIGGVEVCEVIDFIYIAPGLIDFTLSSLPANCNGDKDGTASVVFAQTPMQAVDFLWSDPNAQNTQTATGLASGLYEVTVSSGQCSSVSSIFVNGPIDIEVDTEFADCDGKNGQALVRVLGGTQTPTFEWSNGSTEAMQTGLTAGKYKVTVRDPNSNCETEQIIDIVIDPTCLMTISGYVFDDADTSDCVIDALTLPIPGVPVKLSNGDKVDTDVNGYYEFLVPVGDYVVTVANLRGNFNRLCTDAIPIEGEAGIVFPDNNFYFERIQVEDLSIRVFKEVFFQGETTEIYISATNDGTVTKDAVLSIFHDPNVFFRSASPGEDRYAANVIEWDLDNFAPGEERAFQIRLETSAAAPVGTVLSFFFRLDPSLDDATPANNVVACQAIVEGLPLQKEGAENRGNNQQFEEVKSAASTLKSSLSPNPSRARTQLIYHLPKEALVTIQIYDVRGNQISSIALKERKEMGWQEESLNLPNLTSGIYFIRLQAGSEMQEVIRWVKIEF